MKCKQCGVEFEGKFCPECGSKAQDESSGSKLFKQQKQPNKKDPFYKKWWFIVLVVIAIIIVVRFVRNMGEKVIWEDMIIGDVLPEPESSRGEIHYNYDEELYVDIYNYSTSEFNDYVKECERNGFTVDAKSRHNSYEAYNTEGYKLNLSHYESMDEMSIILERPMELSAISWPESTAGNQLPTPKSLVGSFSYEREDGFFVYVGNMTRSDYEEYVSLCYDKGFNVDYDKGESYYSADNTEGWSVCVRYEGNNTMSIDVDAPNEEKEEEHEESRADDSSSKVKPVTNATQADTEEKDGLRADFKAAMDSYEQFMGKYVTFMKKYMKNPGDFSLITEYAKYMSDYSEFCNDFAKWEDEDMNDAEIAYYLEVQTRVNKRLLEISY